MDPTGLCSRSLELPEDTTLTPWALQGWQLFTLASQLPCGLLFYPLLWHSEVPKRQKLITQPGTNPTDAAAMLPAATPYVKYLSRLIEILAAAHFWRWCCASFYSKRAVSGGLPENSISKRGSVQLSSSRWQQVALEVPSTLQKDCW